MRTDDEDELRLHKLFGAHVGDGLLARAPSLGDCGLRHELRAAVRRLWRQAQAGNPPNPEELHEVACNEITDRLHAAGFYPCERCEFVATCPEGEDAEIDLTDAE